jgi:hypothetical protein
VVLSAEYGAVDPDEVIEPYDRFLEDQSAAYKHEWALDVIDQLESLHGPLEGKVFELHASRAYGHPIEPLLRARGATLTRPLDRLGFGEHLQWYADDVEHTVGPTPVASDADGLARRITQAFVRGELDLSERRGAPRRSPLRHGCSTRARWCSAASPICWTRCARRV